MAYYSTEGIILKRSNYADADRILTIFSLSKGKIKAIAKGVRKITSRKGGNVELFNRVSCFLAKGKNLDIITEAKVIDSFPNLRENLDKVAQAYYVVEIVDVLTVPEQPNRTLYQLILDTLGGISAVGNYTEAIPLVQAFEREILKLLGFWTMELEGKVNLRSYIEDISNRRLKSPDTFLLEF